MKKAVNANDRRSGLLSISKRGQFGKLDQQAIVSGADSTADEEPAEAQSVITQVIAQLLRNTARQGCSTSHILHTIVFEVPHVCTRVRKLKRYVAGQCTHTCCDLQHSTG